MARIKTAIHPAHQAGGSRVIRVSPRLDTETAIIWESQIERDFFSSSELDKEAKRGESNGTP